MRKTNLLHLALNGICLGLLAVGGGLQARAASVKQPVLLVVNQGDVDISIVDPATAQEIATVPEDQHGVHVHEAAVSPDGKTAYLPVYGSTGVGKPGIDGHEMLVMDVATHKIVGHLDFGHSVRPHCAVYSRANGLLYVTTELDKAVTVIDPKTLKIVGHVPTGQEQSHMLAVSRDGKRGYTANVGPGTVSVLDMVGRKTLAVIPVSGEVQRIALSANDGLVFTSDQTQPRLAVIDTATNKLKSWIALPGLGYGAAATRDGRWLLVAIPAKGQVAVVDLRAMKVARTIAVPSAPQEILIRPDGKVAYVSCNQSAKVAAIDLGDWKVQSLIGVGHGADGLAWAR